MRAVLVAALASAVALHTSSAFADQKPKCRDANGQYDNLTTQAYNQVECSSSSHFANPGHFDNRCRVYGAGERFSGGILVLPRNNGGGIGRGKRGRGMGRGRGKVTLDRRVLPLSPPNPLLHTPPPSPNPAKAPGNPHYLFDQLFPHLDPRLQSFYKLGMGESSSYLLEGQPTIGDRFFYSLGRVRTVGTPIPPEITAHYYYYLGYVHAGGQPKIPEAQIHKDLLWPHQQSGYYLAPAPRIVVESLLQITPSKYSLQINNLRQIYSFGIESASHPSNLPPDAFTPEGRFFHYLGRSHGSGEPIPYRITAEYFYNLGYVHANVKKPTPYKKLTRVIFRLFRGLKDGRSPQLQDSPQPHDPLDPSIR